MYRTTWHAADTGVGMPAVPFAVMQETAYVGAVCTLINLYVGVYVDLYDAEDSHFQLL